MAKTKSIIKIITDTGFSSKFTHFHANIGGLDPFKEMLSYTHAVHCE